MSRPAVTSAVTQSTALVTLSVISVWTALSSADPSETMPSIRPWMAATPRSHSSFAMSETQSSISCSFSTTVS